MLEHQPFANTFASAESVAGSDAFRGSYWGDILESRISIREGMVGLLFDVSSY